MKYGFVISHNRMLLDIHLGKKKKKKKKKYEKIILLHEKSENGSDWPLGKLIRTLIQVNFSSTPNQPENKMLCTVHHLCQA